MSDAITARQFHDSDGVEDWRVVLGTAQARFRTDSFTAGVELVDAIGELAEGMNHHPDVDLRYATVTVRVSSHDVGGLSRRDVTLARRISLVAKELEHPAETDGLLEVEIAVDALDRPAVRPFWRAVLGYAEAPPEDEGLGLTDPAGYGPSVWFQQMDAPRPQRNRIHLDVSVPHDQAEARVTAAIAAGGHLVSDSRAPAFWVLADVEGNEACICTWQARD
ncbi:VOC family protein [Oerskovia rustica]|uniref:Putative pterin-4-alpha-carbinolamine dehydratase n=1 Tax=Oerskovia rustica TaxID=2762237 RepID=A0ABR8RW34_9CELL|nr:VOC family protein [Oerskovia rustica]MBD7951998.1 4a-hydroxytetrahydrobiopterin dehydratase [Oerskovia rustica]